MPSFKISGGAKFFINYLALHPFHAATFPINHFGSAQKSLYPWSSAPPMVIHRFGYFYLGTKIGLLGSRHGLMATFIKVKCSHASEARQGSSSILCSDQIEANWGFERSLLHKWDGELMIVNEKVCRRTLNVTFRWEASTLLELGLVFSYKRYFVYDLIISCDVTFGR